MIAHPVPGELPVTYKYTYTPIVVMPQKTLYVRDADLPIWEAAQKAMGQKSMSTFVIEALREKLSTRDGYDYAIRTLNGGEVGISVQSDRAQQRSRLDPGVTIVFKGRCDATEYVEEAEAEGFTFNGKEVLSDIKGRRMQMDRIDSAISAIRPGLEVVYDAVPVPGTLRFRVKTQSDVPIIETSGNLWLDHLESLSDEQLRELLERLAGGRL
jgi:hypothetical protein